MIGDNFLSFVASVNKNLLFHYTTSELALTKILKNGELKFGFYSNMNDPLEFLDCPREFSGTDDLFDQYSHKIFHDVEIANQKRKHLQLICFCRDNFELGKGAMLSHPYNRGWARSRMWSQYADNHKGVCLIFDKERLTEAITDFLIDEGISTTHLLFKDEVSYGNAMDEYKEKLIIPINNTNCKNDFSNWFVAGKEKYLFHKIEDYRDEQEYRFLIVNYDDKIDDKEFFISIQKCIVGIIIGCNFEKTYLQNIKQYSAMYSIPAYKVDWNCGIPSLSDLFQY